MRLDRGGEGVRGDGLRVPHCVPAQQSPVRPFAPSILAIPGTYVGGVVLLVGEVVLLSYSKDASIIPSLAIAACSSSVVSSRALTSIELLTLTVASLGWT